MVFAVSGTQGQVASIDIHSVFQITLKRSAQIAT